MSQPGSPSLRTWLALAVYCTGSFTTMLNLGFLSPLLRPIGASFGVSDAVTGQLATLGALVTFVAALAATPWMDRWSRAAWYRLLGLLLLVGTLLSAAAPTFGVLVIARIVAALGASVVTANSMTGARELFPDAVWRNRAIGILVSATTFGFVAGLPAINQIAAHLNWRVAVASMALPVLIMIGGTWVLPPSSQFLASARQPALASFRAVLGSKRVRGILVALGLNLAMYTGWLVYFGAYITEVFSASAALLSTLFLISGLTELAANNLTPPVLRRFSAVPVLLVMLALAGGSLLLTGVAITTVPAALVAAIIILNTTAAAYIACNALLLEGDHSHPGAVMSVASAGIGLGNTLGPALVGWALAVSG
ncbi:MAG: MFS transporter, partial [Thermomicrobiales bacterium]|nr:MFS transporter [Thermomicrobiales bacterium]